MLPLFPMVLGADGAGIIEQVGEDATRFSPGDRVFGQLWVAPFVEAGTDAEYVAVSEDATLARVPDDLDFVVAAALPTTGMTGLLLVEDLKPLDGKTMLIVGAGGGVGSFAAQYAVAAGAHVIANVRSEQAERLRGYGVAETVDSRGPSLIDAVRHAHPDGIDVLMDLASDADGFSALASLVRPGGTAVTTRHVADVEAVTSAGITGINFGLRASPALLEPGGQCGGGRADRGAADHSHHAGSSAGFAERSEEGAGRRQDRRSRYERPHSGGREHCAARQVLFTKH